MWDRAERAELSRGQWPGATVARSARRGSGPGVINAGTWRTHCRFQGSKALEKRLGTRLCGASC